jgi:hypothetical protein
MALLNSIFSLTSQYDLIFLIILISDNDLVNNHVYNKPKQFQSALF